MMEQRQNFSSAFQSFFYLISFIMLLSISGCGGPKIWKIGFIGPMSGDYGELGKLFIKSVELAIQEFHDKYGQIGGRDIQVIVKDSVAQTEPAIKAAKELIEKETDYRLDRPGVFCCRTGCGR